MEKKELTITISSVKAVKTHQCDYCGKAIGAQCKYYRIDSRINKVERFPTTLRVCNNHDVNLLPFSLLLVRSK